MALPRSEALRDRQGEKMKIRSAVNSDLKAVENLLATNDLPTDGVRDNFSGFVVADDNGAIAGAIGLEKYGSVALLRSAVVSPTHRGSGVGRQLVEQLLERAEESGVNEIYLLTTTAEEYFPRFGFSRTNRTAVPDALKSSAEFRGACPDTAIVMSRLIGEAARARQ
jgi:amino-acid N-acetyltransferase